MHDAGDRHHGANLSPMNPSIMPSISSLLHHGARNRGIVARIAIEPTLARHHHTLFAFSSVASASTDLPTTLQVQRSRHENDLEQLKQWNKQRRYKDILNLWNARIKEQTRSKTDVENKIQDELLLLQVLQAITSVRSIRNKGPRAEQLVQDVFDRNCKQKTDKYGDICNAVIKAWSRTPGGGPDAERWLKRLQEHDEPNVASFAMVIHAYHDSPQDAQRIFDMIKLQQNVDPNVFVFTSLIKAYCRACDFEKCQELLNEMQQVYSVQPNVYTFSIIMSSMVYNKRSENKSPFKQVLDLWEQMMQLGIEPDITLYNVLMHAWATSRHENALEEVNQIMKNLKNHPTLEPTVSSYNTWIHAVGRQHPSKAPQKHAMEILQSMIRDCNNGKSSVLPDALTYSAVLQSWAKSHDAQAPFVCESLLKEMQQGGSSIPPIRPYIQCYDALLDAWARYKDDSSNANSSMSRNKVVTRVLEIIRHVESSMHLKPSVRTYNAVLLALSRNGEPAKAQEILESMPIKPNTVCWTSVITGWANQGNGKRALELLRNMKNETKPNIFTYTSVMSAFAKHGQVQQVKELMEEVEYIYQETGRTGMRPNVVLYNVLFQALANAKTHETARKAQDLAMSMHYDKQRYHNIEPDVQSFTTVLQAWANLGEGEAAQDLLTEMHQLARDKPGLKPNPISYTSVMKAWVNSREEEVAAKRVCDLLNDMDEQGIKPNDVTLTTAIDAFVQHVDFVDKAYDTLKIMISEFDAGGRPPPLYAFHVVHRTLQRVNKSTLARNVLEAQHRIHP